MCISPKTFPFTNCLNFIKRTTIFVLEILCFFNTTSTFIALITRCFRCFSPKAPTNNYTINYIYDLHFIQSASSYVPAFHDFANFRDTREINEDCHNIPAIGSSSSNTADSSSYVELFNNFFFSCAASSLILSNITISKIFPISDSMETGLFFNSGNFRPFEI